jgi:hypothetical protein
MIQLKKQRRLFINSLPTNLRAITQQNNQYAPEHVKTPMILLLIIITSLSLFSKEPPSFPPFEKQKVFSFSMGLIYLALAYLSLSPTNGIDGLLYIHIEKEKEKKENPAGERGDGSSSPPYAAGIYLVSPKRNNKTHFSLLVGSNMESIQITQHITSTRYLLLLSKSYLSIKIRVARLSRLKIPLCTAQKTASPKIPSITKPLNRPSAKTPIASCTLKHPGM